MKFLKRLTLLGLTLTTLYACKKQNDLNPTSQEIVAPVLKQPAVTDGRVVFSSDKEFFSTVEALSKKSNAEIKQWASQIPIQDLESFLTNEENQEKQPALFKSLSDFAFPYEYRMLLNSKGEIQIGDEVVVYTNGYKYYVPKQTNAVVTDFAAVKKKVHIDTKIIDKNNSNVSGRIGFGDNSLDAYWQKQFYQESYQNIGNRKFVHEIKSFTDYASFYDPIGGIRGYTFYTELNLRVKLEWKGRKWYSGAGETRNINYNLVKDIYLRNVKYPYASAYANIPFTGNISDTRTQNSDLEIRLGAFSGNTVTGGVYWEVDLRGSIYQYVLGDLPGNAWNNSGNPLW